MTFIATSSLMFIITFFFNDGTQAPDLANYVFTTRAIKQIKIKIKIADRGLYGEEHNTEQPITYYTPIYIRVLFCFIHGGSGICGGVSVVGVHPFRM